LRKRLVILGTAALALFVGLAGFAANTAEWVNVVAHVEKEIELACVQRVDNEWLATPAEDPTYGVETGVGDCNYGVVFPQTRHTMVVELTASASALADPGDYDFIVFDLYWECKLVNEFLPWNATTNPCRETLPDDNALNLDGRIRDYVQVTSTEPGQCLRVRNITSIPRVINDQVEPVNDAGANGAASGHLQLYGGDTNTKCFYGLELKVPACGGHVNRATDPFPEDYGIIRCDENVTSRDPQDWQHWADLGDNFKVQVINFVCDVGGGNGAVRNPCF
jgi:hypothetical protein